MLHFLIPLCFLTYTRSAPAANLSPTTDHLQAAFIASIASDLSTGTYVLRSNSTGLYLGYNTTVKSIDAWPGTPEPYGWQVGEANWDDSDGSVNGVSTVIGSNRKRSLASGSPLYCEFGIRGIIAKGIGLTEHTEDGLLTAVMNTCDAPSILKARELCECPLQSLANERVLRSRDNE
jgi:hypothetical protein